MIDTIFGKKGSGKSTLSKELMVSLGGRVVFLSPVENLTLPHTEAWSLNDAVEEMETMQSGQILLVRIADMEAIDVISQQAIYDGDGFTIVIDEVDKYKQSKEFLDMIHYSRHFKIHIIANTRRYVDVPRLLTSQSDVLYISPTNEPRDIQYLKDYTDLEAIEMLRTVPAYSFLEYPSKTVRTTRNLHF